MKTNVKWVNKPGHWIVEIDESIFERIKLDEIVFNAGCFFNIGIDSNTEWSHLNTCKSHL
jgi:hypothetical protein